MGVEYAVEWSGGSLITLADLPGAVGSGAASINDAGTVVGVSGGHATEWERRPCNRLGRSASDSKS